MALPQQSVLLHYTVEMSATPPLEALRAFSVVAQDQSFTKAAQRLGQDKSGLSRAVRGLEQALGVALLVRTTRSVRLTPDGEALLRQVAPALAALEQALSAVPNDADVPSGLVTLTTTPDLGRAVVAPALVGFRQRFPGVRVRVLLSHEVVDLLRSDVDVALRVGRPGAGQLVARKVGELSAGLYATPAYLERRGTPARLEQLASHDCLWPRPGKGQQAFGPGGAVSPGAVESADFGFLAEVARRGGGVALLPTFLGDAATDLVRVLPSWALAGAPLYVVSRPRELEPTRVRALRVHLVEQLRAR